MTYRAPRRSTTRRVVRMPAAALLGVAAAVVGTLGYQSLRVSAAPAAPSAVTRPATNRPPASARDRGAAAGRADGVVPDGVTVFDDAYPAVANLDPALLAALRRAATDAARDRIEIYVDSGWRSPKYQEQLLDEAVAKYGSRDAAARWVATPETSAHVSGDAVDIGHAAATAWMSEHGAAYGLCRTYANERWHFELRPAAVDHGCPAMYADPTDDPRMQR